MSPFIFKLIVFSFMLLIAFNLFHALYFLVSRKGRPEDTARALGWRIGLSMGLFLILVALKLTGIVEPHTLNDVSSSTLSEPAEEEPEGKTLEEIQQQDPQDGRIRLKQ